MSLLKKLRALCPSAADRAAARRRLAAVVLPADLERIDALEQICREALEALETHRDSAKKLQRILFGPKTEKAKNICPPTDPPADPTGPKKKRKGHGRRGSRQYTGANQVQVPHPTIMAGQCCEECGRGKMRPQGRPAVVTRLEASPLVRATVYTLEVWRCDTCGVTATAPPPPQAGTTKYADNVGVAVSIARYGGGLPNQRLARLQEDFGVPMPEGTQWELTKAAAQAPGVVLEELIRQTAQSSLVHNDDTGMRVQELRKSGSPTAAEIDPQRTGTFTTSLIGTVAGHPVALFFTGWKHAGENLADLLAQRAPDLGAPIQMCDALSRNLPKDFTTLLGLCLSHGRREFVDIHTAFPAECQRVITALGEVYHFDAQAKKARMDAEQRLKHHQTHSAPVMRELKNWLDQQMDGHKVEPNSGLGKAINYLRKHWDPLTLFLRHAGAPLDNNICERALKMAILHRKNSLGYKTVEGARVGDLFMSLIQTCRLNRINAYQYLLALVRNIAAVTRNPAAWLPWNYPTHLTAERSAAAPGVV